jgi:hypothetical protein
MPQRISIPIEERDLEDLEQTLLNAEQHVRNYIFSQISPKMIRDIAVSIEIDDSEGIRLNCAVDIELIKKSTLNPQTVSEAALEKLFEFLEEALEIKE